MKLSAAFPVRTNPCSTFCVRNLSFAENIVAFSDGKVGISVSSVEERKEPLENFVFVESLLVGKCHFSRATEKWKKLAETKFSLSHGVMCKSQMSMP